MTIGSNDCQAIGIQVEINATHHWTQLVVGSCEKWAVYIVYQHMNVESKRGCARGQFLGFRKHGAILSYKLILTILINNFNTHCLGVYLDNEGLLVKFFYSIKNIAIRDTNDTFALTAINGQLGRHYILFVTGCNHKFAIAHLEEEAIKDGHRALTVYHFHQSL